MALTLFFCSDRHAEFILQVDIVFSIALQLLRGPHLSYKTERYSNVKIETG